MAIGAALLIFLCAPAQAGMTTVEEQNVDAITQWLYGDSPQTASVGCNTVCTALVEADHDLPRGISTSTSEWNVAKVRTVAGETTTLETDAGLAPAIEAGARDISDKALRLVGGGEIAAGVDAFAAGVLIGNSIRGMYVHPVADVAWEDERIPASDAMLYWYNSGGWIRDINGNIVGGPLPGGWYAQQISTNRLIWDDPKSTACDGTHVIEPYNYVVAWSECYINNADQHFAYPRGEYLAIETGSGADQILGADGMPTTDSTLDAGPITQTFEAPRDPGFSTAQTNVQTALDTDRYSTLNQWITHVLDGSVPDPTTAPVTVPDCSGLTWATCNAVLANSGLQGNRVVLDTEAADLSKPASAVISTDPPAGTAIDLGGGGSVLVTVTTNPDTMPVAVPDIQAN
jgi:hypothetical protein